VTQKPTDSHAQGTRYFCGICGGTLKPCTHQRELAHAQGTTPAWCPRCNSDKRELYGLACANDRPDNRDPWHDSTEELPHIETGIEAYLREGKQVAWEKLQKAIAQPSAPSVSEPRTVKLGVIEFHSERFNPGLIDRFFAVTKDLRDSASIVDVWLMDIATVLLAFGYEMTITTTKKAPRAK
jgi:hypothetical protein